MTRVLHVVDGAGDGEALLPAAALTVREGEPVVVLGGGGAEASARAAGLMPTRRVAPDLAASVMRSVAGAQVVDELVAWSPRALRVAQASGLGARVVIGVRPDRVSAWSRRQAMHAARSGAALFVGCETASAWGFDAPVVEHAPCGVRSSREARAETRALWAEPARKIVALIDGDGTGAEVDAFFAFCALTIVRMAGRDLIGVCRSSAAGLERGKRLSDQIAGDWAIRVDDRAPWRWLAGCDAAMVFGETGVAHGWVDQLGLPVIRIAPAHRGTGDGLTDAMSREAAAAMLAAIDGDAPSPRAAAPDGSELRRLVESLQPLRGAGRFRRALPAAWA